MSFKLGTRMEDDDSHQPHAPRPPRPKVKVARSRDQSEPSWRNAVPLISGRRGHAVSAEPDGHTSCIIYFSCSHGDRRQVAVA